MEMLFLSDILRQVTERNRRVIVNFDKASYSLIHARQEENLNEYERFRSPGITECSRINNTLYCEEIRKENQIKKYPNIEKYYEKKAEERAARIRENKLFFMGNIGHVLLIMNFIFLITEIAEKLLDKVESPEKEKNPKTPEKGQNRKTSGADLKTPPRSKSTSRRGSERSRADSTADREVIPEGSETSENPYAFFFKKKPPPEPKISELDKK